MEEDHIEVMQSQINMLKVRERKHRVLFIHTGEAAKGLREQTCIMIDSHSWFWFPLYVVLPVYVFIYFCHQQSEKQLLVNHRDLLVSELSSLVSLTESQHTQLSSQSSELLELRHTVSQQGSQLSSLHTELSQLVRVRDSSELLSLKSTMEQMADRITKAEREATRTEQWAQQQEKIFQQEKEKTKAKVRRNTQMLWTVSPSRYA